MAVNLPDLANGLKQINTGVIPGDQRGDSFRTVLDKINSNSSITLTSNDNIAATGLEWNSTTRKLALNIPLNHLPVHDGIYPYNVLQFGVVNDTFQIIGLDSSLLTGSINPTVNNISLPSNNIFIGDFTNKAVAKVASPIHFIVNPSTQVFELNEVPYAKLTGVTVLRSQIFANDTEFLVNPPTDRITIGTINWTKIGSVDVLSSQLRADPVEFDLTDTGGILRIGEIDWEKIAGVHVSPTQLLANPIEFDLTGLLLRIRQISFSKIVDVSIVPGQIAVNPLQFFTNTPLLTIKNIEYDLIQHVDVTTAQIDTDNTDTDLELAESKSFLSIDLDTNSLPIFRWKSLSNNQGMF